MAPFLFQVIGAALAVAAAVSIAALAVIGIKSGRTHVDRDGSGEDLAMQSRAEIGATHPGIGRHR